MSLTADDAGVLVKPDLARWQMAAEVTPAPDPDRISPRVLAPVRLRRSLRHRSGGCGGSTAR